MVAAFSRSTLALVPQVAELKAGSRQLESAAHSLTQSHMTLSKRIEQLKETIALKAHFLQIEVR